MTHRRRMGTGSIYHQDGRWVAVAPRHGSKFSAVVGHFERYDQAEKAIAAWIKANREQPADQESA